MLKGVGSHCEFNPLFPVKTLPKFETLFIVPANKQVTLFYPNLFQLIHAGLHQKSSDTLSPEWGVYNEVMQKAPAAIVTTHYGANKLTSGLCDKAEIRVSIQKKVEPFYCVSLCHIYTRRLLPQGIECIKILGDHFAIRDPHGHLSWNDLLIVRGMENFVVQDLFISMI